MITYSNVLLFLIWLRKSSYSFSLVKLKIICPPSIWIGVSPLLIIIGFPGEGYITKVELGLMMRV